MKLEEMVPSREMCERLKAAGFPQDCQFGWVLATPLDERAEIIHWTEANQYLNRRGVYVAAAPTFAEIAERLPDLFATEHDDRGFWRAWIRTEHEREAQGVSCAEAAALLWLALNAKGPA